MKTGRSRVRGAAVTEYLVMVVSAVFIVGLALTTGFVNPLKRHTCDKWFGRSDGEAEMEWSRNPLAISHAHWETDNTCRGTIGFEPVTLY